MDLGWDVDSAALQLVWVTVQEEWALLLMEVEDIQEEEEEA